MMMHHYLMSHNRLSNIKFPMFHDNNLGLGSTKAEFNIQQFNIEQTMDDDVKTDLDIMRNARGTCVNDLDLAYDEVLFQGINMVVGNVEAKSRVRFPHFYGRDGKFKNEFKVGYAYDLVRNPDYVTI